MGRDGETRTPDPLLPKQVRYQLRHIPVASMLPAPISRSPWIGAWVGRRVTVVATGYRNAEQELEVPPSSNLGEASVRDLRVELEGS